MSVKSDRPIIRMVLASGLSVASLCAFNPGSTAQAQATAPAGKGMKLLKLSVTGNKRVPTADITSAMTLSVGQKVTKADLAANLNAIVDVYRRANVGAGFKQKMTIPHPGQVLIAYIIEEQAAPPPQAAALLRVDRVAVEGNKQIKSEAIQSVITLKPGDPLDEAKVSANMQAILALYKKAGIGVQITPSATYPQPNHAILDYRIQEKAAE